MCNNARIRDGQLFGQPTEGALLALSMKVSEGKKILPNCFIDSMSNERHIPWSMNTIGRIMLLH